MFIAHLPIDTTEGELKRMLYWKLDTCSNYDIEILPYTTKNKYQIVVHCKHPFIDEIMYAEKFKNCRISEKLQEKIVLDNLLTSLQLDIEFPLGGSSMRH